MFGVATATVRDALQTLRDQGIIETRRGRSGGTFIIGIPKSNPNSLRDRVLSLSMAELRDLEDEQVSNGLACTRLAIDRADPADVDRLERLARQMGDAATTEARVRADSRFHIELAVLAQSERLMATTMRLLTETIESLWTILDDPNDAEWAMADHLAIVDAIRSGNLAHAEVAVRNHVTRNTYRLIAWRIAELYPVESDR
jgi:DNA-binding FadR family transcriptional regulator